MEAEFTSGLKKAFSTRDKQERSNMISEITDKAKKLYEENEEITDLDVNSELKKFRKTIVRTDILKNKNRIDGRGLSDVRPIMCEVGIFQGFMDQRCLQGRNSSNCNNYSWNIRR